MSTLTFDTAATDRRRGTRGLRRLGLAGFLFFFAKGLVWLAVAAAAWSF